MKKVFMTVMMIFLVAGSATAFNSLEKEAIGLVFNFDKSITLGNAWANYPHATRRAVKEISEGGRKIVRFQMAIDPKKCGPDFQVWDWDQSNGTKEVVLRVTEMWVNIDVVKLFVDGNPQWKVYRHGQGWMFKGKKDEDMKEDGRTEELQKIYSGRCFH